MQYYTILCNISDINLTSARGHATDRFSTDTIFELERDTLRQCIPQICLKIVHPVPSN